MIDLLFPKPVYRKENLIDEAECIRLEIMLKDYLKKSGISRTDSNNIDSSFYTNNHLDRLAGFESISQIILNEGKEFLKSLSYDNYIIENCSVQKMWANISYENDYIFPHNHGDCLIAGVIYIKVPPDSKIYFFDNLEKIQTRRSSYNNLSYEEVFYDCKIGMLLMFENYMVHGNKKQPPGEKIAISFNIGI